ncbi:MAG: Uma2 family endonuclease [Chloroflexi bacterium]|nr:Uma2 family endonuclease [Chloroflexota bacterium]MCI0578289.1 Uma2 family endonuclease [Chloroflexota bacterium]MCI0648762.1 Uma2 family endonuclease [Chloroflexota bacterium]MCI0727230.1 Uma2 family endonuclease [Chloroflexota bacterium]
MIKNPPVKMERQRAIPRPGEWTYADYLALPDDGKRYEVIAGVLYEMAPPSITHQLLVAKLMLRLGSLVEQRELGVLLPSPLDLVLGELAAPVQPDLVFVSAAQRHIVKEHSIEGVPDLVIEILSPSSIRHDRITKFGIYEAAGIPEYWIVNPKTRTVEIYQLVDEEYTLAGEYGLGEEIASPLLGSLPFTVDALFEV